MNLKSFRQSVQWRSLKIIKAGRFRTTHQRWNFQSSFQSVVDLIKSAVISRVEKILRRAKDTDRVTSSKVPTYKTDKVYTINKKWPTLVPAMREAYQF